MNHPNSAYREGAANHLKQRRINTGRFLQESAVPTTAAVEEPLQFPELPADRMLTTKQAAAILAVSPETMKKWRQRGTGPEYVRYPSGAVRYRLSAITKFLQECATAA